MSDSLKDKRLISLDLFRGSAILGVVLIHALIFGIFGSIETALNVLPPVAYLILAPCLLFAPMAGLFVFISMIANTVVLQKRLRKGHPLSQALQPVLITSAALLVLHFIFPVIFNHSNTSMFHPGEMIDALLPASIRNGHLVLPRFENLLLMDAMAMIASSGLFFVATAFFLFRKTAQSEVIKKMTTLIVIGFLWTFLAPFVWSWAYRLLRYFYFQENALRILAIPTSFFAAKIHPITTTAPFAIFGMVFGIWIDSIDDFDLVKKKCLRIAGLMVGATILALSIKSFLCFAKENALYRFLDNIGIVNALALNTPGILEGDMKNAVFNFLVLPPELLFLGLSLCFAFFPFVIEKLDGGDEVQRKQTEAKVAPVRRFGTNSLTVFFFESTVFAFFAKLFHSLLPMKGSEPAFLSFLYQSPFYIEGKVGAMADAFIHLWPMWLLYLLIVVGFWFLTLKIHSYFHYRFTLEYLLVLMTQPFRKIRSEKIALMGKKSSETSKK